MVKKFWWYVHLFRHNSRTWQTHRHHMMAKATLMHTDPGGTPVWQSVITEKALPMQTHWVLLD